MKLSRIRKLIFLHLQHLPMKSRGWRTTCCKWGGVNVLCPQRTFVGAGSVVTKDIPDYEVWAGNPARFIKKRELE